MGNLGKAISLLTEEVRRDKGVRLSRKKDREVIDFNNGDSCVGIFSDSSVYLKKEKDELHIRVVLDDVIKVDYDIPEGELDTAELFKIKDMADSKFEKTHGQVLENGEDFTAAFNNGVLYVSLNEDGNITVELIMGKPHKIDYCVL